MKHLLLTIIAAVVLVGCGESQQSAPAPETAPVEPVAESAQTEPPTAKAPDISIHDAAKDGNIKAVKQHLAAGADADVKGGWMGGTPLHYAAVEGRNEIAKLLIAKGADVNAKGHAGQTPLHVTASFGHKGIAELLISKGADVNAKDDKFGFTPLDSADDKETANLLRKNGGKTSRELKSSTPPPPEADKALLKAIRNGKIEMVKEAIANGANVNTFNINIISPLHFAVSRSQKGSNNNIVELLISKGADVNFMDMSGKYSRGFTPLIIAVRNNNVEGVRMLLANGADINAKDGNTNGESPLFYSLNSNNIEITKMLIDEGADFNMRNNKNLTPLDRVIGWNDDFSADLLRKHGGKTGEELKAEGK